MSECWKSFTLLWRSIWYFLCSCFLCAFRKNSNIYCFFCSIKSAWEAMKISNRQWENIKIQYFWRHSEIIIVDLESNMPRYKIFLNQFVCILFFYLMFQYFDFRKYCLMINCFIKLDINHNKLNQINEKK